MAAASSAIVMHVSCIPHMTIYGIEYQRPSCHLPLRGPPSFFSIPDTFTLYRKGVSQFESYVSTGGRLSASIVTKVPEAEVVASST